MSQQESEQLWLADGGVRKAGDGAAMVLTCIFSAPVWASLFR